MPPEQKTSRDTSEKTDQEEKQGLKAGVARIDITPETGRSFQGYVRPDILSEGVGSRLFARALVLDDGSGKVALVSVDLLYGTDKDGLLDRVRPLGFGRGDVLYAGTHTHAATEAGEWTTSQVAEAVSEAEKNKQPAVAGWGTATVSGVSQNRSLEAHLANHGRDIPPGTASPEDDPEGSDHPREEELNLLRIDSTEGDPIAVWAEYAVHPTTFPPSNTLYSSDLFGVASEKFSEALEAETSPVSLFGNKASGDLIPVYDGYNKHAVAERQGKRLTEGMLDAWERAEESLSGEFPVSGHTKAVEYDGQEVEQGKTVASQGVFGLPFLGGAKNGPSPLYGLGLQGRRRPEVLADSVHGRKIPVAPTPWDSEVEAQLVRLGDTVLLGAPGEPTVETGRRWSDEVVGVVPDSVSVRALGLTNGYNGYFTTPEEYDQQHYEGGHTVFGKHTEALLRKTYTELASELGVKKDRDGSQEVGPLDMGSGTSPDSTNTEQSGSLLTQPTGKVERMSVVTVGWSGSPRGKDMPVGEPFVSIERCTEEGWATVATDLNHGLVWTVDDGRYTARYEVPRTQKTGTYRMKVKAERYELETDEFEVVPSTDLRVLGAELNETRDLVFYAQNPPPDPDCHLRSRRLLPDGGKVEFNSGGRSHTAVWDKETEAWKAEVDVSGGDKLVLPEGALTDGLGNRSGDKKVLEVGEVSEATWPSDMEPGGGHPPGPFGVGRFPK
jgi:neutral ceramidase